MREAIRFGNVLGDVRKKILMRMIMIVAVMTMMIIMGMLKS